MTIEYSSSRGDVAGWYWYSLTHNPKHLRNWLLGLVATGLVAFAWERQAGTGIGKAAGMALLAAVFLAIFLALYPQVRFKPQKRTLSISQAGISTTINARSRTYTWSDVASVIAPRDQVFIAMTNGNAFVVPSRAFASAAQRDEFIRQCLTWHKPR